MAEEKKAGPTPIETPHTAEDRKRLFERLERVRKGEADKELKVSLRVAGGAPSQRYDFAFSVAGDGKAAGSLDCALTGRRARLKSGKLDVKLLAGLAGNIRSSGILELPEEPRGFLPDTVIGVLEIGDGKTTLRHYFAADPEQAKAQDAIPTPVVVKVVEKVYGVAKRLMGDKPVKP